MPILPQDSSSSILDKACDGPALPKRKPRETDDPDVRAFFHYCGEEKRKRDTPAVHRPASEIAAELLAKDEAKKERQREYQQTRYELRKSREDLVLTLVKSGIPYACNYCGALENIHVDHIVPVAKGGGSGVENLQFLCQQCNLSKGAKPEVKTYQPEEQMDLF